MNLCETFKYLANCVWRCISESRKIDYPLKEETLTDINIFHLKQYHPEIKTIAFTKWDEGKNGADWEWWFSDGPHRWLGFRVQAKILNIKSDNFDQLYYQKDKTSLSQCDKLIFNAKVDKISPCIPIYVLYMQSGAYPDSKKLRPFSVMEDYGCSLVSAYKIRNEKSTRNQSLRDWQSDIIPWHELVCVGNSNSKNLLDYIADFANNNFAKSEDTINESLIIENPPVYVQQIENSDNRSIVFEENLHNLAGAVIFKISSNSE